MEEDLIAIGKETTSQRLVNFYKKNTKKIYWSIFIVIFLFIVFFFYIEFKKKNRIAITDSYIQATIHLKVGNRDAAKRKLKEIILSDNSTYATLALNLMINQNLVEDNGEILNLFDSVINNSKHDEELKNLLLFKKGLIASELSDESQMLEILNQIINSDSLWKPHALILLGDFFYYKKDFSQAKSFYEKILSISNLDESTYEQAVKQIMIISNE